MSECMVPSFCQRRLKNGPVALCVKEAEKWYSEASIAHEDHSPIKKGLHDDSIVVCLAC
jgi:hypothetical protein